MKKDFNTASLISLLRETHEAEWEATPSSKEAIAVDIHPNAEIGVPFMIDHGTGIVIGATTIIGKNVSIYQGVTLGALQVAKNLAEVKRHPTVEDNVIIYARSTILWGETVIGANSIIGGSVFLTKRVDPNSQVFNTHKLRIVQSGEDILN